MQSTTSSSFQSGVFILGMPRSGANILSKVMNNHSQVCCGPNTYFYDQLDPMDIEDALNDPQWPKKAANLIGSLLLNKRQVLAVYGMTPSHIYQKLINQLPTRANMFLALQQLYLNQQNKSVWIEKTPEHLLKISEILKDFPEAKIILVTRDPRDLANSMAGLPEAYHSIMANGAKLALLHEKTFDETLCTPQILKIKYEDMIDDIGSTIKRVCSHIGVVYEPEMLKSNKEQSLISVEERRLKESRYLTDNQYIQNNYEKNKFQSHIVNVAFTCKHYIENFEYPLCEGTQARIDYQVEESKECLLNNVNKLGLIVVKESKFAGLDEHLAHLISSRCKLFLYKHQIKMGSSNRDKSNCLLLYLEGSFLIRYRLILKALKAKFMFGHQVLYLAHQPNLGWWKFMLSLLFRKE